MRFVYGTITLCKSKSMTIPASADIEVFMSLKLSVNFGKRCVVVVAIKELVYYCLAFEKRLFCYH